MIRVLLVTAAVLLLAGVSVSIVIGREQAPRDWRDDVTALRASERVVLPAKLPPDLGEVSAVTGNGLPLVSFSSRSGPTVTVCTGREASCRAAAAAARTLRNERVGSVAVLVTVDPREGPVAGVAPLGARLAKFWSTVRLTTSTTRWLATPSA